MTASLTDAEYDQIQEKANNHDIWTEFRDWLIDIQGVSKTTARTYATQARRILRELEGDITSKNLFAWINARPASHRTPFRSSWRRYRLFMNKVYKTKLATFPQGETVPDVVIIALRSIKERNIGSGAISSLTIEKDESPRKLALAVINRAVEDGSLQVILDDKGALFLVPSDAYDALVIWGRQGSRLDDTENPRWLVPSVPGAQDAMKTLKITRLLRNKQE